MNIDHILHPEILLSRRGNPADRDFYKELMAAYTHHDESSEVRIYFDRMRNLNAKTYLKKCASIRGGTTLIDTMKRWTESKQAIYYVPKNFCEALLTVQKDIKLQYLPKDFIFFLAFPKDRFFTPKGAAINGVYIRLFDLISTDPTSKTLLQMCFVSTSIISGQGPITLLVELSNGQTVFESLKQSLSRYNDMIESMRDVINISVNALLFIHHEVTEIKQLAPAGGLSKTDRNIAKASQGGVGNLCTVPISLLSFDFHDRQRNFSVESTKVRGHYRWQPHGSGLTKLKLVWINEHERHYQPNELEINNVTAVSPIP